MLLSTRLHREVRGRRPPIVVGIVVIGFGILLGIVVTQLLS